jgi:DNA-binding CsgD family transcriptional regulator/MFS family permease
MSTQVNSYFNVVKKHPRIILILGLTYGSLISFIVYGPVMQKIADGFQITLLSSLGLACVALGLIHNKRSIHSTKKLHGSGLITCILLLLFGFLPYALQILSIALLGYTAGGVLAHWAFSFASVNTENRTQVICLALFIAYGSKYLSNILVSYVNPIYILAIPALLILGAVSLLNSTKDSIPVTPKDKPTAIKHKELFFLIVLIYFTAGITYVGIFPQFSTYNFQKFYNVFPFLAAVFIAGIYLKDTSRKYLLYTGISFLGLSFTFNATTSGVLSFLLIQTSSEISWALINIYILVLLYDLASASGNMDYFIFGSVSLTSGTLLGGVLTTLLIHLSFNPSTYGALAQIPLFISIAFLFRIPDSGTMKDQPPTHIQIEHSKEDIIKLLTSKFNFTPREIDVALLLLAGYNNSWIAKQLYISPNTVKYHTKNIFLKMNVNDRNEIIGIVSQSINTR